MQESRSTLARGVIAGVIGAITLALVFLALDLVRGNAFYTPAFLAGAIFGRSTVSIDPGLIALFTVLHVAIFVLIGILVAWAVERTAVRPHFLLGAILGFLLFDILFYAGVVVTGIDVVSALGWPAVLAGNVLAGVAMFAYLQATSPAGTPAWSETFTANVIIREGLIAGMLGAVAVAAWFLVIDLMEGRLFYTPAALGSALFLGAESPEAVSMSAGIIAGYSVVHVLAFIAIGLLAAALFRRAEIEPPALLGAVLLFVTLEAFAIGLIAILASWLLDRLEWWTIAVANLVAGVVMGVYLWRAHPAIRDELARESLEEPSLRPTRA